jgi:hypothetical protein
MMLLFAIGCAEETGPSTSQGLTIASREAAAFEGSFVNQDGTALKFSAARNQDGGVSVTLEVDGFIGTNEALAEGGGSLDTNGVALTEAGRSALAAFAPSLETWLRQQGASMDWETGQALVLAAQKLSTPGVVEAVQRHTSLAPQAGGAADADGVITPNAICWGYYYTLDGQCRASSGLYQNARNTCGAGNWPSTIQWQTYCGGGPDPYYHWYIFTCCHN